MSDEAGDGPHRLDRWLWHVRAFKTRSAASEACRGGQVKVNAQAAKAASNLSPGDVVTITGQARRRVLEVVSFPLRRVGAPEAAQAYLDKSPPPITRQAVPQRDAGAGRPTKRDRRRLDRLRRT